MTRFFEPLEKRFGFGIFGAELERMFEGGASAGQVAKVQEVVHAHKEMSARIERPQTGNAFGDFSGFVEHSKLVVFGGEEIES